MFKYFPLSGGMAMKDVLKIAVLGLGGRGTMLVRDELVNMKDAEVAVV